MNEWLNEDIINQMNELGVEVSVENLSKVSDAIKIILKEQISPIIEDLFYV